MSSFTIYPALDLRGGRVVRLKQGRTSEQTVYSDNPAATALEWQQQGAAWLHVVDLDRAFGEPDESNRAAIAAILKAVSIPVQLGGGLRDAASIGAALELGARRVVVGTLAVEKPDEFAEIAARFGPEQVVVALDMQDGKVAVRGWQSVSNLDAATVGRSIHALGIERALVTDIRRDGMLTGIDIAPLVQLARATDLRVIASGGIATLDDLRALRHCTGDDIEGAIVGQALYAGAFTLREALAC